MRRDSLTYFVMIRGFIQFGLLAATLYTAVILLWPGREFAPHDFRIMIGCPVVGLLWGLVMYIVEKRRQQRQ